MLQIGAVSIFNKGNQKKIGGTQGGRDGEKLGGEI